jgi:hypothetical protein
MLAWAVRQSVFAALAVPRFNSSSATGGSAGLAEPA